MSLNVGELVAYLSVNDKDFTGKIDSAGGKFSAFAGSAVKYGAAIGAATVAAGVALYKVGSTFDDVSDTIRVGTGATGVALDGLNASVKNIGREVPANFSDIGVAVADLNTRLGLTGKPLEAMATQFLNLSRITKTDLASNIQGLTRVFGDWSIATEQQPAALDKVFRASQATGVGVDKLGQQVVQFGAPMRQLGFSFEETLGLLGSFDKAGVNTEVVMGSMRIALGKMARAGEDPASTFQRVTEGIKNAGSAGEANALALELFGAKAGPDMAAAIREGRFEIGELVDQIANGTDTINTAAKDTEDFAEMWQVFKNRVLIYLAPLATAFFNAIGDGMDWLMNVGVPAVQAFAAEVTAKFASMGASGDGLGAKFAELQATGVRVFNQLRDTISTVIEFIRVAWDKWGQTLVQYATATFGNLMRLVEGALRVIKGVFDVFIGVLTGDWSRAWEGIKGIFSGAWLAITAVVRQMVNIVQTTIRAMLDALVPDWRGKWESIKSATSSALDSVVSFVRGLPGRVVGALSGLGGSLSSTASSAWAAFLGAAVGKAGELVGFVRGIPGRISGALGNLGGLLSGAGRAVIDGFVSGITGAFGRVRDTLSRLTGMLPDWKGPATRDAMILRDAGRLVMGGFEAGLVDKFGDVKSTLGSITADIGDVAGMRVGGPSFVQDRLGIRAGASPATSVTTVYNGDFYSYDPKDVERERAKRASDAAAVHGLGSLSAGV